MSLIANTDRGEQTISGDFRRAYALKMDFTGNEKYFSIIPSIRDQEKAAVGFFGGWNVSDALLLYLEGNYANQTNTASILTGASYTLAEGTTFTVEYYCNGDGSTDRPIGSLFTLSELTSGVVDAYVRKNYLMIQCVKARIGDKVGMTLRWTYDMDDSSGWILTLIQYDLNDHTQLFTVTDAFTGGNASEFGCLLKYSAMAGVSFTL
jgi:hypothetical protein